MMRDVIHCATVLATCLAISLRLGSIFNKTPAKAFTPPVGMKMGARLSFVKMVTCWQCCKLSFADLLQFVETT